MSDRVSRINTTEDALLYIEVLNALPNDQIDALREQRVSVSELKDHLAIFESGNPVPLENLGINALVDVQLKRQDARGRAGGDEKVVEENKPKTMSLGEFRTKKAVADKTATEFVKTPVLEMNPGDEIQFRVKKVSEGEFGLIVVASEIRVLDGGEKFVTKAVKAYTKENRDAPKVYQTLDSGTKDLRIETFIVNRATEKETEFHKNLVYWAHYIGEKKVPSGTFKQASVMLVGSDFVDG